MKEYKDLQNIYANKPAYIVGKGASLEFLTREYFVGDVPVLCINESIVVVQDLGINNPIYSLQKDGYVDHMIKPNDHVTLVLQDDDNYSRNWFPEHKNRILIDPIRDQGFSYPMVMAVRMCINLAVFMGCNFISFVCCDSLKKGDLRTFNVFTRQSNLTGAAEWYEKSIPDILNDLQSISHCFVTPELNP